MKSKTKLLSMKEQKFITAYASNGGNGVKAAEEAYDVTSKQSAAVIANKVLNRPSVAEALRAEMERQGITLTKIIKPVADALEATDEHDHADHRTRLAAHDRAVKLLEATSPQEKDGPAINFNIHNAQFGGEFVHDEGD